MGRVNDTVSNVNSAFRNLLMLVLVGGAGYGGYKAYDLYNAPQKQLAEKEKLLADKAAELEKANNELSSQKKQLEEVSTKLAKTVEEYEKLQVATKLLKVRHRLALIKVLDQREIPSPNVVARVEGNSTNSSRPDLMTKVEFVEINDDGEPISQPKQFDVQGDMLYVDFLHVTFDEKFIEQSDIDRSTSLALFQRVFGEHQEPVKGFQLDTVGTRPTAYGRGTPMSDFEKKIWDDFWLIANDPPRAKAMGIRAVNGQAPSIRVRPGMTYEIELGATGNPTIRPLEPKTPAPAGGATNNK